MTDAIQGTPRTDAYPTPLIERSIDEALHPKGMSTHQGMVRLSCSHVQRLLTISRTLERECNALRAENLRLHERLEDNHAFNSDGKRVEFEPGTIPDGIECRDETIRLQDEQIASLRAEVERLAKERDVAERGLTAAIERSANNERRADSAERRADEMERKLRQFVSLARAQGIEVTMIECGSDEARKHAQEGGNDTTQR